MTDRLVVLVNGLSGAGKSTLARALSVALRLPLFSKDLIKETHADHLGHRAPDGRTDREWRSQLGVAAGETLWRLLADAPAGAVVESPWLGIREIVVAVLARAGVGAPVEIWCDVPLGVARRRVAARAPHRHPVHGEPHGDERWAYWSGVAEPLALGPVHRVDATGPVALEPVLAWIGGVRTASAVAAAQGGADVVGGA